MHIVNSRGIVSNRAGYSIVQASIVEWMDDYNILGNNHDGNNGLLHFISNIFDQTLQDPFVYLSKVGIWWPPQEWILACMFE